MKYPNLPAPYLNRSSNHPELYSAIQMYDYCDAGIIELDKLLDKAIQEIDDLKKQNKDLSAKLDEASAIIDMQSKALDQLYGDEL